MLGTQSPNLEGISKSVHAYWTTNHRGKTRVLRSNNPPPPPPPNLTIMLIDPVTSGAVPRARSKRLRHPAWTGLLTRDNCTGCRAFRVSNCISSPQCSHSKRSQLRSPTHNCFRQAPLEGFQSACPQSLGSPLTRMHTHTHTDTTCARMQTLDIRQTQPPSTLSPQSSLGCEAAAGQRGL